MSLTVDPSANSSAVSQALWTMQNSSPTGAALLDELSNSSIDFHVAVNETPGFSGLYDPATHTLEVNPNDLGSQSDLIQDLAHEAGHAIQDAELGLVDTSSGSLQWGAEALFDVAPSDIGVDTSSYNNNELNFGEMFAQQGQEKVANELGLTFEGPQWNADGSFMTQQQFDSAVQNIEGQVSTLYGVQGADVANNSSQDFWYDYSYDNFDEGDNYW